MWLVVVDVFIQNEHSALTSLRPIDNGVFRDLRALSVPASRRRKFVRGLCRVMAFFVSVLFLHACHRSCDRPTYGAVRYAMHTALS